MRETVFHLEKNSEGEDPKNAQNALAKVLIFMSIDYVAHVAKMDRFVVRRPRAAIVELASLRTDQLSTDSVATAENHRRLFLWNPSRHPPSDRVFASHHAARLLAV